MSNHTIIVSDLHIDDWTDRKIRGKSGKEHFFAFLDWCVEQQVRELVINGDRSGSRIRGEASGIASPDDQQFEHVSGLNSRNTEEAASAQPVPFPQPSTPFRLFPVPCSL